MAAVSPRLGRRRIRGHADRAQRLFTGWQGRKVIGFAVSRMAADEAELLSIAIDATQRGRGLSRNLLLTHLGHLAGRGVRKVFLEVEENNQPARRLYEWAGFEVVGRRERYYQQPAASN